MSGDKRKTQRPMTHFFANLFSFRKKVDGDKGQKKASAASAAEVKAEFDQVKTGPPLAAYKRPYTVQSMMYDKL